jgi:hypothetical protein
MPDWNLNVFGELSVKLIPILSSSQPEPYLVMLSNHPDVTIPYEYPEIKYRTAPLSEPWNWSDPTDTDARGYGPYIIDRYTEYDSSAGVLTVWHVLSVWLGDDPDDTPYGVYTTSTSMLWPP